MFVVNNFCFASCKMVIILSEWVKFGQGTSLLVFLKLRASCVLCALQISPRVACVMMLHSEFCAFLCWMLEAK